MENKIYMVQMEEDKAVWVCDLDEIFFGKAKRIYCSGTPTDDSGITEKVKTEVLNRRLFYAFTRPKENTSLQNCIDFCIGKKNMLSSGFVPANLASKIRLALEDAYDCELFQRDIHSITEDDVQRFFEIIGQWYRVETAELLKRIICTTFEIFDVPFDATKVIPVIIQTVGDKKQNNIMLTPKEYEAMITFCRFDNRTRFGSNEDVILFCLLTGLPLSEAITLTYRDISFDNRRLKIKNHPLFFYRGDMVLRDWVRYKKATAHSEDDYLFVCRNGTVPKTQSILSTLNSIGRHLYLPRAITGKSLTKSFVIWQMSLGTPINNCQRYLGKSDTDISCVCGQYKKQRIDPYAEIRDSDRKV